MIYNYDSVGSLSLGSVVVVVVVVSLPNAVEARPEAEEDDRKFLRTAGAPGLSTIPFSMAV